ncbi:phytoene desaturase family protein [Gordonia sp. NPDC003424]
MTDTDYDVVVVGSGHNGLIAAGYLAKSGRKVLVLERMHYAGGGVATLEMAEPGFWSERHSALHVLIQANPLITDDELGLLGKHGLEYISMDHPYAAIFDDGTFLPIYRDTERTVAEIERFSAADANAYRKFVDAAVEITDLILPGFFVPPVDPATAGAALAAAPYGPETLRAMGMSVSDVFGEWFSDERVLVALNRLASEIITSHPDDKNTGIFAYAAIGIVAKYGISVPRGGGVNFTNACIRALQAGGGDIRLNTEVDQIIVENGRAVGVRTTTGETIRAREAVLGSIHPHLLASFLGDNLDPAIAAAAEHTELSKFTGFVVHAALNEPLRYKCSPDINNFVMNTLTHGGFTDMLDTFDTLRRGRFPEFPLVGAGCPSVADPSRAPEGNAVLHLFCLTTYDLEDGGPQRWEEIKEDYAKFLIEYTATFYENLDADNIRDYEIVSPLDHEKDTPSFRHGDINGIAMLTNQLGAARPTPALADYTVPGVEGLYLVGPFQHPGGGVVGGGRPVAIRMLADLDPASDHAAVFSATQPELA